MTCAPQKCPVLLLEQVRPFSHCQVRAEATAQPIQLGAGTRGGLLSTKDRILVFLRLLLELEILETCIVNNFHGHWCLFSRWNCFPCAMDTVQSLLRPQTVLRTESYSTVCAVWLTALDMESTYLRLVPLRLQWFTWCWKLVRLRREGVLQVVSASSALQWESQCWVCFPQVEFVDSISRFQVEKFANLEDVRRGPGLGDMRLRGLGIPHRPWTEGCYDSYLYLFFFSWPCSSGFVCLHWAFALPLIPSTRQIYRAFCVLGI